MDAQTTIMNSYYSSPLFKGDLPLLCSQFQQYIVASYSQKYYECCYLILLQFHHRVTKFQFDFIYAVESTCSTPIPISLILVLAPNSWGQVSFIPIENSLSLVSPPQPWGQVT